MPKAGVSLLFFLTQHLLEMLIVFFAEILEMFIVNIQVRTFFFQ